jgi:hypothetical protein
LKKSPSTARTPGFEPAKLVTETLADECRFQADAPLWDGAPTVQAAADQAAAELKRLRRHPFCDDLHGATELADRISNCSPDLRCGICARCSRAIQRSVVMDERALVAATAPGLNICKMTVIFLNGRVPLGSLDAAAFAPLAAEFLAAVTADKDMAWVRAGFDVSFNDDTAKGLGAAFQIHLHGTCAVESRKAFTERLSAKFPTSDYIYRPVVIEPCDGSAYSLSYSFKTKFYRRIAFWATRRARPCWKTSHRHLLAKQHIELMLALADVGPAGRILTYSTI